MVTTWKQDIFRGGLHGVYLVDSGIVTLCTLWIGTHSFIVSSPLTGFHCLCPSLYNNFVPPGTFFLQGARVEWNEKFGRQHYMWPESGIKILHFLIHKFAIHDHARCPHNWRMSNSSVMVKFQCCRYHFGMQGYFNLRSECKCKCVCLESDVPLSSAHFTIYTPGTGTLSCKVSSPLGTIQHLCTLLQSVQFSFLVPPGNYHCWVERGGIYERLAQHLYI